MEETTPLTEAYRATEAAVHAATEAHQTATRALEAAVEAQRQVLALLAEEQAGRYR